MHSASRSDLMPALRRCLAAALLCASPLLARAQGTAVEREVKAAAGRDARVAVYTNIRPDCTSGPLPAIRLAAPPAHGTLNVKRGTLKATNFRQCLAAEVPVLVALYRATPNFSGGDEFLLEISWTDGRKQLQHFRVNVSPGPGSGQGI